jgi:molybdenum cofactor cytidylyltransferase
MVAVCDRVVVVLGARAEEIRRGVDLRGAEPIVCPDWPEGIFASLRCGLALLDDEPDAVVVALGDQPSLSRERIEAVLAAGLPLARAADSGIPSHPVVIRRTALATLTHPALRAAEAVELGPLADVDTPDDLIRLRE